MSYGGLSCNPPRTFSGTTYAKAKAYLDGGLNPVNRRIGSTSYLVAQPDDSIELVLHGTVIVTYLPDDTYLIDHGGWRTRTTQTWINTFTPFCVGSTYDRKQRGWMVGYTGEVTPPKVQKCRTCSGTGFDPWQMRQSRRTPGGLPNSQMGSCYRCDGTGRCDYGSRLVPIMFERALQLAVGKDYLYPKVIDESPLRRYPSHYQPVERWSPEYIIQGYTSSMLKALS